MSIQIEKRWNKVREEFNGYRRIPQYDLDDIILDRWIVTNHAKSGKEADCGEQKDNDV
jgi:hypothetical protein